MIFKGSFYIYIRLGEGSSVIAKMGGWIFGEWRWNGGGNVDL